MSAVALNLGLMYQPPRGSARSTVAKYVLDPDRRGRALAAAAGFINAVGNTLQFYGAELAGFAAADLVQAYPLVGAPSPRAGLLARPGPGTDGSALLIPWRTD